MGLWSRVFASFYDRMLAPSEAAGLGDLRASVVSQASGRVIEIGAGTGLNLPHYPLEAELVLAEPHKPMARRLEQRRARLGRDAEVVSAPAEALPFADGSFDAAVATLVLCTVPDVSGALGELRRVLRPGAPLLFLEHVRSADPTLARAQDRWAPLWRRVGDGCYCNRDTLRAIELSGFDVAEVRDDRLRKARPIVSPLIVGRALAPAAASAV